MTWTYTPPASGRFPDPVSELRFLLQDTVQRRFSPSDEELQYLIQQDQNPNEPDLYMVASWAAEGMADWFAGTGGGISKTVGNTSLNRPGYGGEGERYASMALRLRRRSPRGGTLTGMGLVGGGDGVSRPRQFWIGMFDNQGGGSGMEQAVNRAR